ncbi:MAG: class I SAM-dependent methyltransferase [Gammaproteobacteria bacterium]
MPAPESNDEKLAQQKAHFDSIAERYGRSRQHRNHLTLKALMWEHFLAKLDVEEGAQVRVLEAMCGFADGKAILEDTLGVSVDYSGFDYSSSVIEQLSAERPELNVWQQDVSTFEATDEYDIVIILGGLHHVPHIAADVVQRLRNSVKPGGYFINLEPTHGNPIFQWIRERIYARNTLFDEETERAFSVAQLRSMFAEAGFESVDTTYPGLLSYVLYYNPDAFGWLNVGSPAWVRALFALERPFLRTGLARALSFATLALWRRPI